MFRLALALQTQAVVSSLYFSKWSELQKRKYQK